MHKTNYKASKYKETAGYISLGPSLALPFGFSLCICLSLSDNLNEKLVRKGKLNNTYARGESERKGEGQVCCQTLLWNFLIRLYLRKSFIMLQRELDEVGWWGLRIPRRLGISCDKLVNVYITRTGRMNETLNETVKRTPFSSPNYPVLSNPPFTLAKVPCHSLLASPCRLLADWIFFRQWAWVWEVWAAQRSGFFKLLLFAPFVFVASSLWLMSWWNKNKCGHYMSEWCVQEGFLLRRCLSSCWARIGSVGGKRGGGSGEGALAKAPV